MAGDNSACCIFGRCVSTAIVPRVINQTAWAKPVTRERGGATLSLRRRRNAAAAIALAKRSGDMLGIVNRQSG
ncbi:hypothetical protein KCP75_07580 [Salmonella enterica subsp. enterica]|nr:hypothetical protein KCP75_07580 [Salmonella enterica subsp. enterica]